jgi:acyl-CoA synthetase (AMP-forming)/AMP-acid ligase II
MNVASLPRAFADSQPTVPALVDKKTGRSLTFAEFRAELDATSAALLRAGLKPGDRAALFVATGIEFVVLVNACFQAGIVPVLIDPGMGAKNVLACVKEQKPRGLIGIGKALVLRAVFRSAFASVEKQVLVGGSFFPGAQSLTKLKSGPSSTGSDRSGAVFASKPDDVAAVLYTSGSTGAPKGVLYTHAMLAGQAVAIRDMFGIKPGEVDVACFLPFGLFSVAMGMTAVFPDMDFRHPAKADPAKIRAALEGATSAFASPALWEPFSQTLDAPLKGLKRVLTAGAPVRPQLHERLVQFLPDGDVFTPYGATEALPVAFMSGRAVLAETAARTKQGHGTCVGTLAPNITVKIIGTTDAAIATLSEARELRVGEIGEIIVRGPCVTRAYDDTHSERAREANLKSKIQDGEGFWHRMGDCGYLDEQGRLWFCGRKAHRVEHATGTLHSIPVEALAEAQDGTFRRAAFVGVGERGQQKGVVIYECDHRLPRLEANWEILRVQKLREALKTEGIHAAMLHPGPLPVDRRHNAKIEREALSAWALQRRPELKDPLIPAPRVEREQVM